MLFGRASLLAACCRCSTAWRTSPVPRLVVSARASSAAAASEAVALDELPMVRRSSAAVANVELLERHCGPEDVLAEAKASRVGRLYLGLDVNTQSTGYTVLRADGSCVGGGIQATLLEWGCITSDGARDVVDIGAEIAAEMRNMRKRLEPGNPGTGGEGPWVVGVEDFMKTFMPGRFNTRGLFKMAQLNGIVGYSALTILGAKALNVHPTSARAFYGLRKGKGEKDDVKRVVFDYVMALEPVAAASSTTLEPGSCASSTALEPAATTSSTAPSTDRAPGNVWSLGQWERAADGSPKPGGYDVTDSYLIAMYVWHRDLLDALLDDREMRARFVEAYRDTHAGRLAKAESRAVERAVVEVVVTASAEAISAGGVEALEVSLAKPAAGAAADGATVRRKHRADARKRLNTLYEDAVVRWFKAAVVERGPE